MVQTNESTLAKKGRARKPRARQISNWLAFIRPHIAHYNALPRGEQTKYLKLLSEQTGSSENTLRRFVSAARVLEAHGIVEFPPRLKRLPAASIELVERIGKKDPHLRQSILKNISEDRWTIRGLKAKLNELKEAQSVISGRSSQNTIDISCIRELIAEVANVDPDSVQRIAILSSGEHEPIKFSSIAGPVATSRLPEYRSAVVFFESSLKWATGPATVTKEFLRNIAVAVTTYDYVVVVTSSLTTDVKRFISRMRQDCQARIRVFDEVERFMDRYPDFSS